MKSNCSVALYFAMCVCDLHERATCTYACERSKDIRPPPPAHRLFEVFIYIA